MSYGLPLRLRQTEQKAGLSASAKKRLNNALNSTYSPIQRPNSSETISQVAQMNQAISTFMEELNTEIDKIDSSKVSVPTWFWNGKDPTVKENWTGMQTCETSGEGWTERTVCSWGASSASNSRGAIQQLAKMLRLVDIEKSVLDQINRVLVDMLGLHTDGDPEEIAKRFEQYRSWIKLPREKGACVREYLHYFIRGSEKDPVQGTNGMEKCFSAVTGGKAASDAKDWANSQINSLNEKNANKAISAEMSKIYNQIKEEVNTLKVQIDNIRSRFASLPTLWIAENEEGVTPEFKKDFSNTWQDDVEEQAKEIETGFEDGEEEEELSLLGPVLFGGVLAGLTFWLAKKRSV